MSERLPFWSKTYATFDDIYGNGMGYGSGAILISEAGMTPFG
jgi:hypothetical protein